MVSSRSDWEHSQPSVNREMGCTAADLASVRGRTSTQVSVACRNGLEAACGRQIAESLFWYLL